VVALRQFHVDELGVHVLEVGEDEQLFQCGVVTHVAVFFRVGIAPFPGGLAEEGDVEKVGLVSVGESGLLCRDLCRDEVGLDGVGVEPIVDLGQGAVEVPVEGEATIFVLLQTLEFLDEVQLELRAEPGAELEGNVPVGKGAAIAPSLGNEAAGAGGFHPFLGGEVEAVPSGLVFNSLEFGGFKIRVVELFPDAEEEDGVLVLKPLLDKGGTSFEVPHHVGEGDEVVVLMVDHRDLGASNVDLGVGGLFLQSGTPFLVRSPAAVVRKFRTTESSVRWRMMHSVDWSFIFPVV
jgi:hypothetical protein